MYRCSSCGCEFEDPAEWKEDRGEYWGTACYQTLTGCPMCYSGYYEEEREEDEDY